MTSICVLASWVEQVQTSLYFDDDLVRCRVCGSSEVELTGRTVETSLNSFDELRCNECGAVHRHRTPKTSKEKRKSLLM